MNCLRPSEIKALYDAGKITDDVVFEEVLLNHPELYATSMLPDELEYVLDRAEKRDIRHLAVRCARIIEMCLARMPVPDSVV